MLPTTDLVFALDVANATVDGFGVADIQDDSPKDNDAIQTIDDDKPAYTASHAPLGGRPIMTPNGVGDNLLIPGISEPVGPRTFIVVADHPTYTGSSADYFLDVEVGRQIFGTRSGWYSYYDGTWKDSDVAATAFTGRITYVVDGTSVQIYRGNTPATPLVGSGEDAIGGSVRLFSNNLGSGSFITGNFASTYMWASADDTLRTDAWAYIDNRWSI